MPERAPSAQQGWPNGPDLFTVRSVTPRRTGALALGAAALALGAAATAHADTYCVGVSGSECDTILTVGSLGARLNTAVNAAEATVGDDVIRLGSGRYDQGPTTLSATFAYNPTTAGTTTGALTIQGDAPGVVLANSGSKDDDETVEGQRDTAPLHLKDLTIEGPPNAEQSLGLEISADGSTLDRVTIQAPAGGASAPTALFAAINVRRNRITIRNSVLRGFHKALFAACRSGSGGSATLQHVTVLATGPITAPVSAPLDPLTDEKSVGAIDASCDHEPGPDGTANGSPIFDIDDSILAPGVTLREGTSPGAGSITLTRTRWDGPSALVGSTSIGDGGGLTTAAPGFVSASDLHLTASSPLIDLGLASIGGVLYAGDRDGSPRAVDGDGNGSAHSDLGAYEAPALPATPSPTATPTPTPGPTPTPSPAATPSPSVGLPPTLTPTPTPTPTTPLQQAQSPLRIRQSLGRVDVRGRLKVKLECRTKARCRGRVRVLAAPTKSGKQAVLAAATVSIAGGRTAIVTFTIRATSRRALRSKGARVSLSYTPTGAANPADPLALRVAKAA
jgi:hypothetical protein